MGDMPEPWEERFSPPAADPVPLLVMVTMIVVVAVVLAAATSIPIGWLIFSVVGVAGALVVLRVMEHRTNLVISDTGVTYLNGLKHHIHDLHEITGVRVQREDSARKRGRAGLRLQTRGPSGDAPLEHGLGSVIWATFGLPPDERRRLGAALGRLLGDDAVTPLGSWVEHGDAADR
jgi:hypothetical protein